MATIFPLSPAIDDIFQGYKWNGETWEVLGSTYRPLTYSNTEPSGPTPGDIWIKSDSSVPLITPSEVAPKSSPEFTGTPTAPTAVSNTNTTQIATTAFVQSAVASIIDTAPSTLNTLNELAAALADDPNFAVTIANALSPIGSVVAYSGTTSPTNWLICNGGSFSSDTYPALATIVGDKFQTHSGTTYYLPDLRDKTIVGTSGTKAIGTSGGSATVQISSANLPLHSHAIDHNHAPFNATSGGVSSNHSHGFDLNIVHSDGVPVYGEILNVGIYLGNGVSRYADGTGGISSDHTHTTAIDVPNFTGTSGDGGFANTALNIQNPYTSLNYIMRAL